MLKIPSGTVTFLFTGLEDSAKLGQENPLLYQTIQEKHDSVLKETIESNNGFIFKKTVDSFCSAFNNARDALNASVEIQRKLLNQSIDNFEIKVRVGIHSGEAEFANGDYSGYITLSKVNRIMSAANAGQILISEPVYNAIKYDDDNYIYFKDFGKRKLKDIVTPEHIFQVCEENILSDFPPINSLDARQNNLPVELTKFIGREKDIDEIRKLLVNTRLLTIVGFGGTGKTRLSVHIAYNMLDEFANGTWFAGLAQLSESSNVTEEIISALKITTDIKRSTLDVLVDFLREKELLLILDNCEHLINECAKITEILLQKCPKVKIIVTSRESLHISGETIYNLLPLSLPDMEKSQSMESLAQYESVRLFIDRVLAVKHDFKIDNSNLPVVAQLCYELDGIPLAIELAAARVKVLPVEKILERLKDRFSLLTGGKRTLLPRQQTLKALIDWSYDLLSEKEKLFFSRLSVFSGGWTLEASENVCSDETIDEFEVLDLLTTLTDKSLIKVAESGYNSRYTMLETIRKYCDEKLTESGKKDELKKKQFEYFYNLVENSEIKLTSKEQSEWLEIISAENENIRDCLRWSLISNSDSSLKMSVALGKFWELRSYFSEGLEFLKKSLENAKSVEVVWKAKAIYWIGLFLVHQGKFEESKKNLHQCLEMFIEKNNKDGEAVTLSALGSLAVFESDYENLELFSNKSLALSREINNKSYIGRNLQNIGLGLMQRGEHDAARIKFEECISVYREINDSVQIAKLIGNIGALEYLQGNYEKAQAAFNESLKLRRELGDRQGITIALTNLGAVAYMQQNYDEAERLLEEGLEITRDLGDRRIYVVSICTLGSVAVDKGDLSKAVKMFIDAIVISNEIGDKYTIAKGLEGLATVLMKLKKFDIGCLMASKFVSLFESTNRNVIEGELIRIEEFKTTLKSNLGDGDFKKYWAEGESMTIEKVIEYETSILELILADKNLSPSTN